MTRMACEVFPCPAWRLLRIVACQSILQYPLRLMDQLCTQKEEGCIYCHQVRFELERRRTRPEELGTNLGEMVRDFSPSQAAWPRGCYLDQTMADHDTQGLRQIFGNRNANTVPKRKRYDQIFEVARTRQLLGAESKQDGGRHIAVCEWSSPLSGQRQTDLSMDANGLGLHITLADPQLNCCQTMKRIDTSITDGNQRKKSGGSSSVQHSTLQEDP